MKCLNVFKNLYNYRELLRTSVKKDVGGKYKNSFLGVLWSFVNPLLQIAVYAIIFPLIMRNGQPHYTLFLCSALIPWTFFSTVIIRSSSTMIENGNNPLADRHIKAICAIFNVNETWLRTGEGEILPISVVTSKAVNFVISTILIVGFAIFEGVGLSRFLIFYPIVMLVQYVLLIGISLIVSSITVYVRDMQHIIGVLMQLLFYTTPIVYNPESIPADFSWILRYNPMTYLISAYRSMFYLHQMPNLKPLGILLIIGIIICVIGYAIFSKLQRKFAEEL